jgi:phage shock protein PspC (stress-responsive transcriptional regulator)
MRIIGIILIILIVAMMIRKGKLGKENDGFMANDYKELRKSATNRMLCGVCGGIGEYFNIDPTIVRLIFVLIGCTGTGLVAYLVMAIIMPD